MLHLPSRDVVRCDDKKKFATYKAAVTFGNKAKKDAAFHKRNPEKVSPYKCSVCGQWHLGHAIRLRGQYHRGGWKIEPYNREKFNNTIDNIYS